MGIGYSNRMRAFGLVGMLVLSAATALSQPKDVTGWTRIRWGMTVSEARAAFPGQASDARVAAPQDAILVDRFVVNDIQVGRITAEAAIETEQDSDQVVAVRLRATGASAAGQARTSTFSTFKHLLIAKYGAPQSEDHSPFGNGGTDHRVLWLFPSTSITLRWTEMSNGENGFVTVRYEALDRKALDAL